MKTKIEPLIVGMEFTYIPSLQFNLSNTKVPMWELEDFFNKNAYKIEELINKYDNDYLKIKDFIISLIPDEQCLEFSTKKLPYIEIRRLYQHTNYIASKYSMINSSLFKIEYPFEWCGGCHISIHISKNIWKNTKLIDNIKNFFFSYPSLIWLFNIPSDNVSSKIIKRSLRQTYWKGDFITINEPYDDIITEKDTTEGRLELRMFMMPRCIEELDIHYKFVEALYKYCYSDKLIPDIQKKASEYRKTNLVKYKYEKAKNECTEAYNILNLNPKDLDLQFEGGSKLNLLKMRFELGKSYLC